MSVTSSVLTLTCISVERFFAIVFPLKFTKSPIIIASAVSAIWLLSIGIAVPQLVVRRRFEYFWKDRHQVQTVLWGFFNTVKVFTSCCCIHTWPTDSRIIIQNASKQQQELFFKTSALNLSKCNVYLKQNKKHNYFLERFQFRGIAKDAKDSRQALRPLGQAFSQEFGRPILYLRLTAVIVAGTLSL